MDDFAARPGEPNAFGLIQGESNAVAPRKRPLSSMTPTIISRNGEVVMVVGASGGPTIISSTLQAVLNVIDLDMTPERAVSSPRLHHQWAPDTLVVEENVPSTVTRALARRAHDLKVISRAFSAVQLVLVREGVRRGASDPRKGGEVAGY